MANWLTKAAEFQCEAGNGRRFLATICSDLASGLKTRVLSGPNLGFTSDQAKRVLSRHPSWLFRLEAGGKDSAHAFGVLRSGRLNTELAVSVLQTIPDQQDFFNALLRFAASRSVTSLLIESIGSATEKTAIPPLAGERERYANVKLYVLDLMKQSLDADISSNHRRNIKKAEKNGASLVSLPGPEATAAHLALMASSLDRRARRGEPTKFASDAATVNEVTRTGAARLYQAAIGGEVVSSKLVFTLDEYGYYDSGGTSEKGMSLGVSHFLMYAIINDLRQRRIKSLNLDVASAAAGGLARYKADFGAAVWEVDRVRCDLSSIPRLALNALRNALGRRYAA